MESGRIVESGTPDELLARNGAFARMVRIQQGRPGAAPASAAEPEPALVTESHHPRWLTPDTARIHLGTHNALHVTVTGDRIYGGAFAVRCRPVHQPRRFISLRYTDGAGHEREIGLIRDLDEWPEGGRQLIEASLSRRYFVHTIQAIHDVRLVNNYLNFDVDTDLGAQRFTMRWQHDRAQDHGSGGKMLLDTDENRYLVPDVQALPERQRHLFQRFVYW
jgi:hypothetical protein